MPLEITTVDDRSFEIPTSEELDQAHAAEVESWLPDCLKEIELAAKKLNHPGEHQILFSIEYNDNDPCLIERLNAELEDTCFYIKIEDIGDDDRARPRPQIFRLKVSQREALAQAKRTSRLISIGGAILVTLIVGFLVLKNSGLM